MRKDLYKYIGLALLIGIMAFLISKYFVWPGQLQSHKNFELAALGQNITPFASYTQGTVERILQTREQAWTEGGNKAVEQTAEVKVGDGEVVGVRYFEPQNVNPRQILSVGDKVVLGVLTDIDGVSEYIVVDRYRLPGLGLLLCVFVILVLGVARRKGLIALAGLCVSLVITVCLVLPNLALGYNPYIVIGAGAALLAIFSALFAHGFRAQAWIGGTANIVTILFVFLLAYLAAQGLLLFGLGSEAAFTLSSASLGGISNRVVFLAAIMIGAMGALDDVTAAQVATVAELKGANPGLTGRELFSRAMRVGQSHIGALVNTLALVYVAASLPLFLLLLLIPGQPVWVILNSESVMEEITAIVVGSMGVVAAVPVSTLLAAAFSKKM